MTRKIDLKCLLVSLRRVINPSFTADFSFPIVFRPSEGASGYQQSNPNVLATISLMSSLQLYEKAGGIQGKVLQPYSSTDEG